MAIRTWWLVFLLKLLVRIWWWPVCAGDACYYIEGGGVEYDGAVMHGSYIMIRYAYNLCTSYMMVRAVYMARWEHDDGDIGIIIGVAGYIATSWTKISFLLSACISHAYFSIVPALLLQHWNFRLTVVSFAPNLHSNHQVWWRAWRPLSVVG